MEKTKDKIDKRRRVIYLTPETDERLRHEQAREDRRASHIVEEALARRYGTEPPIVAG